MVETFPEYSTEFPLTLKTIMKSPARNLPDKTGIVYRHQETGEYQRFTWNEWYERTCQLAHALKEELEIEEGKPKEPGSRVATIANNHHRHHELYYGVPCVKSVLHLINMRLAPEQIAYTINKSEDEVIFIDKEAFFLLEMIHDDIKDTVDKYVVMSNEGELPDTDIEPLYDYESMIESYPKEYDWPYIDENVYATNCYTTGTTGRPKGVMFTHRQLYLHAIHVMLMMSAFDSDPSNARLGGKGVPMLNIPMYHIHAWGAPYYYTFTGHKQVLPGSFTPQGFCELVEKEEVTGTAVVPTMLAMLVEFEDLDEYDLSSLENLSVGGASLSPGLKKKAEEKIPGFTVSEGYGMTETCPVTLTSTIKSTLADLPKDKLDEYRTKTGMPVLGLDLRVVDDDGNPVPRDDETIGEIVIRGPWVMEEYYKEPEKTEEAWKDGWFHTEDLATVDEEGYVSMVDRIDDVIRSGSEMVPTVKLENYVMKHPSILEGAITGVPDEKWGERPLALVKPAPDADLEPEDVNEYIEQGVDEGKFSRWMLPDYVAIVDEIPQTSVGKYDKVEINERLDEFLDKAERVHEA